MNLADLRDRSLLVISAAIFVGLGACATPAPTTGPGDAGSTRDGAPLDSARGDAASAMADAAPESPDAGPAWPATPNPTLVTQMLATPRFGHIRGGGPLGDALFVGGTWVVSGHCDQYLETGGLWTFGADGTPLTRANVCMDALAEGEDPENLTIWAHQYAVGTRLVRVSDDRVLKEGASSAWPYPLVTYDVASLAVRARDYGLIVAPEGVSRPPDDLVRDDAPVRVEPIVVGDRVLALTDTGPLVTVEATSLADPFASWTPLGSDIAVRSLFGSAGQLVIVSETRDGAHWLRAMRLDGDSLVAVGDAAVSSIYPMTVALDGDRVAALWYDSTTTTRVQIFRATAAGLVAEGAELAAPAPASTIDCRVALHGPHLLAACREGWQLWRDEVAVTLPAMPSPSEPIASVAFAPDASFALVRWDGVWLYRMYD
jgi:hypothetical protein